LKTVSANGLLKRNMHKSTEYITMFTIAFAIPCRPLALTVFNLAQSLCATANLATIITVSVPTMSSEHKAKMDTLGPVVMWMIICSSAILILLLTLGPIWAVYCALVQKRSQSSNADTAFSTGVEKKDTQYISKVYLLENKFCRERYLVLRLDTLMLFDVNEFEVDEFDQYDVGSSPCERS
jgi:hypothetical protein